jgi:hypothetical protein
MEIINNCPSPLVSFFVREAIASPATIKADALKNGLTDHGYMIFSLELQENILPVLSKIVADPMTQAQADKFIEANRDNIAGGTCIFSLDSTQREELFNLLRENGCQLSDFQQKLLLTSITV